MKRWTEWFHFIEPILKTSKLGLIRLSVHKSVFNITERNNTLYMLLRLVGLIRFYVYKSVLNITERNNNFIYASKIKL